MFVSGMFLTKTVLVLLLNAHLCLKARGELGNAGIPARDCLETVDLALVVDVSASIEGGDTRKGYFNQHVKPFIKRFAKALNVAPGKAHVGMVTFGNFATLEFNLTSDINEVMRRIDLFKYGTVGQFTNTSGGINVMRTQLLSPSAPNYRPDAAHIAVVITDGLSNVDSERTVPSAKAAQRQGIIMLAVGVTEAIKLTELTAIASPLGNFNISSLQSGIKNGVFTPSSTVAYVPGIEDLVNVVTKLVAYLKSTVCNYIDMTFCHDFADIAFVVDVSGSIEGDGDNPGFFDRYVKTFLKHFVEKLHVGPGKIQIGMVTFSNNGKLEFTLKSDIKEVIAGIDKIVYPKHGENTNTSGGINIMRTQVLGLNSTNYRSKAAHVAIVVTDGLSTYDHNKTVPSADEAKKQGIIMLSIGVTFKVDVQELIDIASEIPNSNLTVVKEAKRKAVFMASGAVSYVPSFQDLEKIVNQLTSYLSSTICA